MTPEEANAITSIKVGAAEPYPPEARISTEVRKKVLAQALASKIAKDYDKLIHFEEDYDGRLVASIEIKLPTI